jgi:hypothetical protein
MNAMILLLIGALAYLPEPSMPTAVTNPATGVTSSAATLNAVVNPNGSATTVRFEWGMTPGYGNTTSPQSIGNGTSAVNVTNTLTALSANQVYHYRVKATNAGGTNYGLDATFTTSAPPPTATTNAASGVMPNGVTLNGTVNPNGWATTVSFEWGATTAYGNTTTGQAIGNGIVPVNVTAALTGLTANQAYHYRVKASNGEATACGTDAMFVTPLVFQSELSYNPRNAKGVYPFVSYLGGPGLVNLVNGNLVFSRQLVARAGRAGFDLDLGLVYNSKVWERSGSVMRVGEPGSAVGLGWRLEFPKVVQGTTAYAVVFPDGSSHEIADYGGGVSKSVDSSYIIFDPVARIASLPGGVKLIFGNSIGNVSYLTEMKDRNGNQIKATYLPGTAKLSQVEDTLGTAALFYYNTDGSLDRILSLGKVKAYIYFTYDWRYLGPYFSTPTQGAYERLLTAVTIKAGQKDLQQYYWYDDYGLLWRVDNNVIEYEYDESQPDCRGDEITPRRSDGVASYQYQTLRFWDAVYGSVEERVVQRKTESVASSGGTNSYVWEIYYDVDQTKSNPSWVSVTDDKGRSEYYLNRVFAAGVRDLF